MEQIRILSEEEKLQLRQQRFNSGENISTIDSVRLLEEEKRKIIERQKKFGVIHVLPEIEEEKKKQRLERFGPMVDSQNDDEEKRKKRAERFGIHSEEDRMKERAERFKGQMENTNIVSEGTQNLGRKKMRRFRGRGANKFSNLNDNQRRVNRVQNRRRNRGNVVNDRGTQSRRGRGNKIGMRRNNRKFQ